jgi:subtilisin family serine protease
MQIGMSRREMTLLLSRRKEMNARTIWSLASLLFTSSLLPAEAAPPVLSSGVHRFEAADLPAAQKIAYSEQSAWIEPKLLSKTGSGAELDIIVELAAQDSGPKAEAADVRSIQAAETAVAAALIAHGAQEVEGLSHHPLLRAQVPAAELAAVARIPSVAAIYANEPVQAARVEGGSMIGAFHLQAQSFARGQGVGVAVFDTGIDASHPEFVDRVVAGIDVISGGDPFTDVEGHGTAVAGIVHGMAPDAHLFAFKVLDDEGHGSQFSIIAGLNSAYANRSAFGGIRVINASLAGGGPVNANCDKRNAASGIIKKLDKAGIVMVFSSGNDGYLNGISAFACHSKLIAVGAVYDGDIGPQEFSNCHDDTTTAGQIACYSNSGVLLDVLAPAHNTLTTAPGGGYEPYFGGTSAAAPYVAGVIAQLRSRLPHAKPAKIRNALLTTGTPLLDSNGVVRRLVSATAAYRKLGGR